MRRIIFIYTFLLFVYTGIFAQQQYTVAVTPFELVGGFTQNDADVIYELFVTELGRTKGIKVVDRNSFNRIQAQMDFELTDWSDNKKIAEFGKALNANCFIRGQLMTLAGKLIISARVVDVNTTQILSAAPLELNNLSELFSRLPGFTAEVVKHIIPVTKPIPPPNPNPGTQIGDNGPAGGIIFLIEGDHYYECSIRSLGRNKWNDAKKIANEHRGGGYSDWRLPTIYELSFIFKIRGKLQIGDTSYWSSQEAPRDGGARAKAYSLMNGYETTASRDRLLNTMVVRSYKK